MKRFVWVLLLWPAVLCHAQTPCSSAVLNDVASRVRAIQQQLGRIQVEDMDTAVPATARDRLSELKDVLSCLADVAVNQAGPSVDASELENQIADFLTAHPQQRADATAIPNNDRPGASFGQDVAVRVSRPPNMPEFLEAEFSVGIPCGDDNILLLYSLASGRWKRQLRWQAPPLKQISDAFGDFFVSGVLSPSSGAPLVVVAHGTPWCTSRLSGFGIDVLSAGPVPDSPKVLWHTQRGYSRGDFAPTLKCSGDTFELRINESSFDIDSFERSVIYRYRVDDHQVIRRIEPIAIHARGFVEEWLSAPWVESEGFSVPGAGAALQIIHEEFRELQKPDSEFVTHSHGPVRACHPPGTFQVEVRSTLEKIVPGKPGGESQALPTRYFHVRETKAGYLMMSAPSEPDPSCQGRDLMAKSAN